MLFEDGAGFCPWHKRDSSFKVVHEIETVTPHFLPQWGPQNVFDRAEKQGSAYTGLVIMECLHCGKSVVLLETVVRLPAQVSGGEETEKRWRRMVSPAESPRELHESAPEEVCSLFAEASTCEKAKAFRAAGVMYRATVEEVVKEQGATGANLYTKIDSLKGTLSNKLVRGPARGADARQRQHSRRAHLLSRRGRGRGEADRGGRARPLRPARAETGDA